MTAITGPVRVRFAPSPTGYLHIGGVRTALFNWLFARHYGGQFILRIEDTDEKRFVADATDDISASLRWVGLDWDEGPDVGGPHGPYVQSQRQALGIYQQHSEQLLEAGWAYMSFTSEEELAELRAASEARGHKAFRFRGPERDWPLEQQREVAASGKPYTIRLKLPLEGETRFSDLVRGGSEIVVQHEQLQDIVLIKKSGMPVYHFAHLVDDHLMGVTHILRAEEWVPSTPYHVVLYQAFGWQVPVFAHLPVILRQDGKGKLSKRKDDVATNRFWERGYLPEALFNYLALQGWSYDDKTEIMSRDELVSRFSIERVQASGARWNPEKLRDLNGIYIRKLSAAALAEQIEPFMVQAGLLSNPPSADEQAYLLRLVPLVHERLEELSQAPELLDFFFQAVRPGPEGYDPALLIPKKLDAAQTLSMLRAAHGALNIVEDWQSAKLEAALRDLSERLQVKVGPLFGTVRVAVSGRSVAPPLFDMLAALGREQTLSRLSLAAAALA
ncbi:glutamate--tRNA ligase [Candidatus Viridilinea mediisalina]|uniref:Glutamate--tRNA ligase n=1 Tax=Candidatus Viridilinea mediisalina TaxID=2024553 RepID=A0A2A6REZ2_9CHLR|nr:glutamate--tRNA ligase [Candidatus Viridilinea mediisalina]PDW01647.1 glutamate--tRNA ligase [Candidatus Viridilinea mediisalina]